MEVDTDIIVTDIYPPMSNGVKFAAKGVIYLADGNKVVLGERWGKTKAEAERKSADDIDDYLKRHGLK